MRADVSSLFPSTAVVLRDSNGLSGGRIAHAWTAAGTYSARLAYSAGGAFGAPIAGRAEVPTGWWLSISGTLGTAALQAGDRVTVDGTTYNVDVVLYTPGETVAWRAKLVEGQ